jgi:hypothetical protein
VPAAFSACLKTHFETPAQRVQEPHFARGSKQYVIAAAGGLVLVEQGPALQQADASCAPCNFLTRAELLEKPISRQPNQVIGWTCHPLYEARGWWCAHTCVRQDLSGWTCDAQQVCWGCCAVSNVLCCSGPFEPFACSTLGVMCGANTSCTPAGCCWEFRALRGELKSAFAQAVEVVCVFACSVALWVEVAGHSSSDDLPSPGMSFEPVTKGCNSQGLLDLARVHFSKMMKEHNPPR